MSPPTKKATRRTDGSLLLHCESGNPQLGVLLTPDPCEDHLILSAPTDEEVGPLSVVNIVLGTEQQDAIIALLDTMKAQRR